MDCTHQNPLQRAEGQQNSSGQEPNMYCCYYCHKDVTNTFRMKCYTCPNFDLCVECFSVGAEVWPHKSNHPYVVMRKFSFSIISADWTADEEMLLLEGIEMFGIHDWENVAQHVRTKSNQECKEHYNSYYMNSPNFIPVTKNPNEFLPTDKGQERAYGKYSRTSQDFCKAFPSTDDLLVKLPSSISAQNVSKSVPVKKRKHSSQNVSLQDQAKSDENDMGRNMIDMHDASTFRWNYKHKQNEKKNFTTAECIQILDEIKAKEGIDNSYFTAVNLFDDPDIREVFISLKSNKIRLAWLMRRSGIINPTNANETPKNLSVGPTRRSSRVGKTPARYAT